MSAWIKVITQPLGLAGFALFLVFGYLAKATKNDARRWLSPVAVGLAVTALVGGLLIAYRQVPEPKPQQQQAIQTPPSAKQQTNSNVQQTSVGQGSPNVQGVQGDVTITVDQSKGKTETQKSAKSDPKPASQ